MRRTLAAFLCAALTVAALFAPPAKAEAPPTPQPVASVFVEPPDLEQRIREITEEPPPGSVIGLYVDLLFALTVLVAVLIFISGIDDAFIDAYYWLRRVYRKRVVLDDANGLAPLMEKRESPFAIMVPAWNESDVIAAMIENTVKTLEYRAYRIFCGVYPNDPATAREVDRMAAKYPDRVSRVDVRHDGPTCKADCLNAIVERILVEEHSSGVRFAGTVLHDGEDVIHPLELKLFNSLVPGKDLVQLPVFSLERKWHDFVAATYIDDFAECHGKDMHVREAMVGIVPGAGVATCYSRGCLAALWSCSGGEPFNTASLTEDYDLSFRLKALRMSLAFAHVTVEADEFRSPGVRGRTGRIVATHEYFPDRFKAACRQRARWALGIAFQGWQQLRWQGSLLERYFLFRDRKAMVMAPAGAFAYLLVINFVLGLALGSDELRIALESMLSQPLLQPLLFVNLAFMANRALQRMYFVGRYYGALQGLLSVVRMPVSNVLNFFAVMRAWKQFLGHVLTGKKLTWDKTDHVYLDPVQLAPAPSVREARSIAAKTLGLGALCFALGALAPQPALAAPPPLTGRAYALADQAYKAIDAGQLERAMQLASEALKHAPRHPSLLLIQADVLSRQGRNAEAAERVRALTAAELGGFGLATRGYIWLKAGNSAAAETDFSAALASGELEPDARANVSSELAYLALTRKDDAAALNAFRTTLAAPARGMNKAGLYADAGYAALRIGRNREAAELLSGAIDEWHAAPAGKKPFDDEQLYGMRRSVDSLSRRWGAIFSIGHTTMPGAAGAGVAGAGSDLRVVQAGAEVYYTPETFGFRDGRIFQWYANAFEGLTASEEGYATGKDSLIAALGARYKPLRTHNLVFAFERRLAVGSATGENDWLARIGYSMSRATDWNPTRDSWTTWQFYTESVYFIEAARLIQPFDARVGRSWKISRMHGAVVTPYVGVAGEYDRALQPSMAAGAGPGLALRYWFGETRHRAFGKYLDFSVQYRYRLTDAQRGGGLFALASVSF